MIPCAVYFTQNPFSISLTQVINWNFNLVVGYNYILLENSVLVTKGSFLVLIQNGGMVAVDQSGNATYSDYYWDTNTELWTKLNSNSSCRLYLTPITNWTTFYYSFSLNHYYSAIGFFNLSLKVQSSNSTFYFPFYVTNGINLNFSSLTSTNFNLLLIIYEISNQRGLNQH